MTELNEELASIENIKAVEDEQREKFEVSVFDRLNNKTTKLINNTEDFFLRAENRKYTLYFKVPVFVQSIFIDVEGYTPKDTFSLSWDIEAAENRGNAKGTLTADKDRYFVFVNRIVKSISFQPPRKILTQKIKSIRVYGIGWEKFDEVCDKLLKIDAEKESAINAIEAKIKLSESIKQEADALKASEEELLIAIKANKEQKTSLEAAVAALLKTKTEYSASIEESSRLENDKTDKLRDLDDQLDKKTNESNSLNSQIESGKTELKKLQNDINQFPADFTGFLEQGGENIKRYAVFTIIPLFLIIGLTIFLFVGSADLSAKYKAMEDMDLYTMLASRLPFTLIAGAIIFASYRLAKFLIEEIMKITRQRLNLTRISIIAKEVSQTSMVGLDLTEKEKAEIQTKLKMDILKAHLKTIVDKDFENKIELSIWDKFRSGTKIPNIKAKADASGGTLEVDNKSP